MCPSDTVVTDRPNASLTSQRSGTSARTLVDPVHAAVLALRPVLQTPRRFPDNEADSHPIHAPGPSPYRDGTAARTPRRPGKPQRSFTMLYYAVVFLIISLIAAVLGFGGIAAGAAGIAKVLFVVFLVLALAGFVASLLRRG
jgi:uncharacterized membrane protein YtjA (UPF0391 family)